VPHEGAGTVESSMAADTACALSWSDQLLCLSAVTVVGIRG
jgi:hypothetical protein